MYRRPALAPQLVERGALAVLARGLSTTRRGRPPPPPAPRAAPAPVAPPAPAAPAPAPVAAAAPARAAPRPRPRRRLLDGALLPRRADPQALLVLHHLQVSLGGPRLRVRVPRFGTEGADDAPAHGALLEASVGSTFISIRRRAPAGREFSLFGLIPCNDGLSKLRCFASFASSCSQRGASGSATGTNLGMVVPRGVFVVCRFWQCLDLAGTWQRCGAVEWLVRSDCGGK